MTESLRALLSGAIDYAGMFPPAGLSLENALAKYRQHQAGPETWMVGRFVCPGSQIGELACKLFRGLHDRAAIIVAPGETAAAVARNLESVSKLGSERPIASIVDMLEFCWFDDPSRIREFADFAAEASRIVHEHNPFSPRMFFELPPSGAVTAGSTHHQLTQDFIQVLAEYRRTSSSNDFSPGFKIRCGGADARAFPSAADIAFAVCACRDSRIFWKATAGLHHPFRHVDPVLGVPVHGFINLLTAAVMADAHRLDVEQVQCILEDDDPWHFRFTNEALTWRELSATVLQINAARARALRSFGSCSIDEPWQDLTVLGLL